MKLCANQFREHVQINIVSYFGLTTRRTRCFRPDHRPRHRDPFPRSPAIDTGIAARSRSAGSATTSCRAGQVGSNYQNSRPGAGRAKLHGYDGDPAQPARHRRRGPGSCVFLVRDGQLHRDLASGILESITRATMIELARDRPASPSSSARSTAPGLTRPTGLRLRLDHPIVWSTACRSAAAPSVGDACCSSCTSGRARRAAGLRALGDAAWR
jgi:hypothetical protein